MVAGRGVARTDRREDLGRGPGDQQPRLVARQAIANLEDLLGGLAGLLAALMASVLGYVLARFVLELDYAGNPWIWLAGVLVGGLGVGLAGILGTRRVVNSPPLKVLRERVGSPRKMG